MHQDVVITQVMDELQSALIKFAPMASLHEGLAVILEEYRELEKEVFNDKRLKVERQMAVAREAKQLAAMAIRIMIDVC